MMHMTTLPNDTQRVADAHALISRAFAPDEVPMRPILAIKQLDMFYGTFQALTRIDMEIKAREITALIGPSGCGKSSFLRCLNRMNDVIPDARVTGEIIYRGENLLSSSTDVVGLRKRIGLVFQRPNPFPMSIFDNVAYGLRIHGTHDKRKIAEIVETSLHDAALWDEVKDKLRHSAFSLSGGQQQRLCIARLLAVEPDILLMDEPASALDPISTLKIEDLMQELTQRYTIVIVTHNMQQAARVSNYTGFFLNGAMIEFDRSAKIFTQPADARTEDYITGRFG
jgi:phosphate transport system ATP-binding protein